MDFNNKGGVRVLNGTRNFKKKITKMNRQEHLQWCKDRAIEILNSGNIHEAYSSFLSDMNKHPDTKGHAALELGMLLMFSGKLDTYIEMKKFIEGFN